MNPSVQVPRDLLVRHIADVDEWGFVVGPITVLWPCLGQLRELVHQPVYDAERERQRFEAMMARQAPLDRLGDRYLDTTTQLRWQGWKACALARAGAA